MSVCHQLNLKSIKILLWINRLPIMTQLCNLKETIALLLAIFGSYITNLEGYDRLTNNDH